MVLQALPIVRLGYEAERAAQDNNGKFNKDKGSSRRYQLVAAAVARSMCWRASISRPARVLAATNIACNVAFAQSWGRSLCRVARRRRCPATRADHVSPSFLLRIS